MGNFKKKKKLNVFIKNSIFVYPFMAYWILIYPVTCLIYMIHNRNKLHDIEINAKLGFYINGYQDDYYYW